MKVVSLGGIPGENDDYFIDIQYPFTQPSLKLERTTRDSGDPLITRARRDSLAIPVEVWVYGADEDEVTTNREAMLAALDTESAAVALVVADDDGGNERYRYVVVQSIDEQAHERGPGQFFVATLVTHGETRWRSVATVNETWNVTASGDTLAVNNSGSVTARPVYTIKPTAAKSGATNAFDYRMFCAVTWDGRSTTHYPVDVVDGTWDTAALVAALKIYTPYAENNIGLLVDGRMTRRWVYNYGETNTEVWANLDWTGYSPANLLTGFGSGDSITRIEAATDISSYPREGILQIGGELFTYTDRDDENYWFTGVTRAAKDSTAEAHTGAVTGGDEIFWIQHDIWILYGGTGYWLNTYDLTGPDQYAGYGDDIYKPMIDFGFSSNAQWIFSYFAQSGEQNKNRSASWVGYGAAGRGTTGDPHHTITVSNLQTGLAINPSGWQLAIAHQIDYLYIAGEMQNFNPGGQWAAGMYYPDNYGGKISYLALPDEVNSDGTPVSFSLFTADDSPSNEALFFEQRAGVSMFASLTNVIVTFKDPPTVALGPEVAVYDLDLKLDNLTTGQGITLRLPMAVNEQLQIDTAAYTVRLLDDDSSQYQALTKDSRRREILPLAPGTNTLRVTEDGLQAVTVAITFETRSYS